MALPGFFLFHLIWRIPAEENFNGNFVSCRPTHSARRNRFSRATRCPARRSRPGGTLTAATYPISEQSASTTGALLNVRACGQGPAVVLVPSLARPASDFDALLQALAGAGF